ncbi:histidinol-phosphatase [Rhodoblastus sphagnicola]|uniref:Histidinol-phosphatase n=1 Tax=Rhodoblastus sphagnicola TaxID=333368 RepID=A0A2S6MZB6_9HYPH|nr:histidinol-phosphatase [Rhodoblastus sphagnicola]MBB4198587.1 myo-inositol-1(or 4)-monophosphatase [Rhodoblastus sphagnicola]PPQ27688.1 histidinol-phosphatase [Rhodoblastus sphagnicola]
MTAIDFIPFVERLATVSGEAIMPFFRTAFALEDKNVGGVFDPVTEADRAAETAMRRLIGQTFPSHGLIGEEFGSREAESEYVWVLDPIDGTKSFISGLPMWGTLIGLLHKGVPCYGMMNQPFTRERFFGDGRAAYWTGHNGGGEKTTRRLRVRPCLGLDRATIMTTSPKLIPEKLRPRYEALEEKTRLSRYGGDCYAYCMLAAGQIDLVVEAGLNVYDIVALIPIIEGAGGIVTSWDGGDPAQGGAVIAAGDKRVHEEALEMLREGSGTD